MIKTFTNTLFKTLECEVLNLLLEYLKVNLISCQLPSYWMLTIEATADLHLIPSLLTSSWITYPRFKIRSTELSSGDHSSIKLEWNCLNQLIILNVCSPISFQRHQIIWLGSSLRIFILSWNTTLTMQSADIYSKDTKNAYLTSSPTHSHHPTNLC